MANQTGNDDVAASNMRRDDADALAADMSKLALSDSVVVAGADDVLHALRQVIAWPVWYGEEGRQLGVRWPKGVLLMGPPGVGKTTCVRAVARECDAAMHVVAAASVFGAYLGESERRLRDVFDAASKDAAGGRPTVIFLDEIDALCPRRSAQQQHESRVVGQLLTLIDGAASDTGGGHIAIVAATNRPNAIDPALRRPGRLHREIRMSPPNAANRAAILRLHAAKLPLDADVDLHAIAAQCNGYSGADLAALCTEAAMAALSSASDAVAAALAQASHQVDESVFGVEKVGARHFAEAMKHVGPSIIRGADIEYNSVQWHDIGGLQDVKRRLIQAVEWPLQHADAFTRLGIEPPRGVLLHGPPGCCKTTLARAIATAAKAPLIPLSCAQLFSMYVGEGESLLRDTFLRARQAAPAIVLLDEVDAVAGKRTQGGAGEGGGAEAGLRLLGALLTEMDGVEFTAGRVLVLAATNRPTAVDPALLRPGRFDLVLYIPPPEEEGRYETLRIHTSSMPLAADVDLHSIAQRTHLYTGAELAAVCREAALAALREDIEGASVVAAKHFDAALRAIAPSLTPALLHQYESFGKHSK